MIVVRRAHTSLGRSSASGGAATGRRSRAHVPRVCSEGWDHGADGVRLKTMNVLILGATGMVGQGVLRECLLDGGVSRVVTRGRTRVGQSHPKLRDVVQRD